MLARIAVALFCSSLFLLCPDVWAASDAEVFQQARKAAHQGKHAKAIRLYSSIIDRGVTTGAELASVYYNRANTWEKMGQLDRAIGDYTKAIKLEKACIYYINRGNAWWRKQKLDKAVADYTRAIEMEPGLATAYHNRSVALEQMGKVEQALADMERAASLAPNKGSYRLRLQQLKDKAAQNKQ